MASVQFKNRKSGKKYYAVYQYETVNGKGEAIKKLKWEPCDSENAAEIRVAEIELAQKKEQFIAPSDITLEQHMKKFCELYGRTKWQPATYSGNKCTIDNHILPVFGHRKLQSITTQELEEFFVNLKKKKCSGSKAYNKMDEEIPCLSSTSRRHVFLILDKAFQTAAKWGLMERNPMDHMETPPKRNGRKKTVWSPETFMEVLEDMKQNKTDSVLRLAIHIAFACTTRVGETCGILISDVDLDENSIKVSKTLQRIKEEDVELIEPDDLYMVFPKKVTTADSVLVLKNPKTKASIRESEILPILTSEIIERIEEISKNKQFYNDDYNDYGLLLCLPNGDPIEPKLMEKRFKKYQQRTGLELPEQIFHGIRYSSTTTKLEVCNGDLKALQGAGGWASADIPVNVYAQMQKESSKKLTHRFGKRFYGSAPDDKESQISRLLEEAKKDPQLLEMVLHALKA